VLEVEFTKDYHTSQIYSRGFEFSFLSPQAKQKFVQATTFVFCKDFLHDALWSYINQRAVSIYSFKYAPKKDKPLCMTHTALAYRNTQFARKPEDFHTLLPACLELLHLFEQKLNFRPSYIEPVTHDKGPCWVVLGDRRWQLAPPLISLYTLLIRVGCAHISGDTLETTLDKAVKGELRITETDSTAGNRDANYIREGMRGIQTILKHGLSIFYPLIQENYPTSLLKAGLHDNMGIVSFSNQKPIEAMPFWFRTGIWE